MQNKDNPVFALDIGTRSVVGIIMHEKDGVYHVIKHELREHQERSMVDGQIHDVVAVSKVIRQVKEAFEGQHGPLEKVAVAAAGRSLKTKRAVITQSIAGRPLLTREDVLALELEGVQLAQAEIAKETKHDDMTNFYCVGYSVMRYFLDQELIGNLVDQRGKEVAVEIIATFLPRVVVDSLISALKRAGLEMEALTLEPIAAINVLIPPTMRRLNVALVDIGAGTSDIAITAEGAIIAYGMVPCAGDEITEAISQEYLLDFKVAEEAKRKLYNHEEVEFEDVLGFPQSMRSQEIVKAIKPSIDKLAEQICEEIITLNGQAPQAVMLIGGGSMTPTLTQSIAHKLKLPDNRVGIRGLSSNQIHVETSDSLSGPEAVTPIGIAIAAKQHPVKYVSVTVNETTLRLFDLRRLTVADAILASGINIKKLYGKPGLALSLEVNGKLRYIPGTHGAPPRVNCNDQEAAFDTPLQENDRIVILSGEDGQNATAAVRNVIDRIETFDVYIDGELHAISPVVLVNGYEVNLDYQLSERDRVHIQLPTTAHDILLRQKMDLQLFKTSEFVYFFNQEEKRIPYQGAKLFVNGKIAPLHQQILDGDKLDILTSEKPIYLVKDLVPTDYTEPQKIPVTFNGQSVVMTRSVYQLKKNDQVCQLEDPLLEGDRLSFEVNDDSKNTLIFSDVFRYVDIEVQETKGKRMRLRVNHQPANFDTPISKGDALELVWD